MNETAKKLREAANYMADSGANSAHAIATVRGLFDVVESDTFGGDLGRVLNVIADELDELQARAAEANNLRQQLESAEGKAERRKKYIGYLNTALHDKNILLKQRGVTIERATAENADLRKQVPSERERQILAMWPRFEDGKPVMVGDRFIDHRVNERTVRSVIVNNDGVELRTFDGTFDWHEAGERVKRPAPKVLDADGMEIKVGDSMYVANNGDGPYIVCDIDENIDRIELFWHENRNEKLFIAANRLTHIAPDSWERLEEDASKEPCFYFGFEDKPCDDGAGCPANKLGNCSKLKAKDLIRRAKALAGVEVE